VSWRTAFGAWAGLGVLRSSLLLAGRTGKGHDRWQAGHRGQALLLRAANCNLCPRRCCAAASHKRYAALRVSASLLLNTLH
jgi:hypothetical protein